MSRYLILWLVIAGLLITGVFVFVKIPREMDAGTTVVNLGNTTRHSPSPAPTKAAAVDPVAPKEEAAKPGASGAPSWVIPLVGRWGRNMKALQELGYTEFLLSADGTVQYSGRDIGKPFNESGTWEQEGDAIVVSLRTQMVQLNLDNTGTVCSADQFHTFQKGVHWDFNKRAYFNEAGERLEIRDK